MSDVNKGESIPNEQTMGKRRGFVKAGGAAALAAFGGLYGGLELQEEVDKRLREKGILFTPQKGFNNEVYRKYVEEGVTPMANPHAIEMAVFDSRHLPTPLTTVQNGEFIYPLGQLYNPRGITGPQRREYDQKIPSTGEIAGVYYDLPPWLEGRTVKVANNPTLSRFSGNIISEITLTNSNGNIKLIPTVVSANTADGQPSFSDVYLTERDGKKYPPERICRGLEYLPSGEKKLSDEEVAGKLGLGII